MPEKIIFENNELLLMGWRAVDMVATDLITVEFAKYNLKISGRDMRVNYYSRTEMIICGNIAKAEIWH